MNVNHEQAVSILNVCEVAKQAFAEDRDEQRKFLQFMINRFCNDYTTQSYALEWAERIKRGRAWSSADLYTKDALIASYGEEIAR